MKTRYAAALLVSCCWPLMAQAQSSLDPEFTGIRVGFEGAYKVGHWTPIELTLSGGVEPLTGVVTITLPDGDGAQSTVVSDRPYQVLPGRKTRVLMHVKPGRPDADFDVKFTSPNGRDTLAEHRFTTRADADPMHPRPALWTSQELVVGLGPSIGIDTALVTRNTKVSSDQEGLLVQLTSAEQLPTRWFDYDGVDRMVVSTSNSEIFQSLSPTSAQYAALKQWLSLGGKLLISVGSRGGELLPAGGVLAEFMPGQFTGMATLRPGRAFETYITATDPLPRATRGGAEVKLETPRLTDVRGSIEVQEGDDLPLVVRAPYGFGEVTFVAADLDLAPFSRWSQRTRLVGKLLGYGDLEESNTEQQNNLMGFNDMAGQLRAGLDSFTGIKIAPFYLVAGLIAAYIVLIGPVDYWLVKHVFKRMEWTWFTFPAMVLLVSGGAYVMAYWMKGDSLLVNQVDVVDVDLTASAGPAVGQPRTPLVRGSTWLNVFSPQMRSYDVAITPHPAWQATSLPFRKVTSWLGLPGGGFGGMNQNTADPSLFTRSYQFAPELDALLNVPIQVWSSKSFMSRWHSESDELGDLVTADLRAGIGDELDGTISQRLTTPLRNCLLAFGGSAYRIGDLQPNQTFSIDPSTRRRLRDELAERRGQVDDELNAGPQGIRWNVVSLDLPTIVEHMMFFEAAGGTSRSRLDHRYQQFVDLSDHLRMQQAILIGRASGCAAPLELNAKPVDNPSNKQLTMYRFLLPVKRKP